MASSYCAALRCSARHALAGVAIATMTSLRYRPLAEVCTVPVLLVFIMFLTFWRFYFFASMTYDIDLAMYGMMVHPCTRVLKSTVLQFQMRFKDLNSLPKFCSE